MRNFLSVWRKNEIIICVNKRKTVCKMFVQALPMAVVLILIARIMMSNEISENTLRLRACVFC